MKDNIEWKEQCTQKQDNRQFLANLRVTGIMSNVPGCRVGLRRMGVEVGGEKRLRTSDSDLFVIGCINIFTLLKI